MGIVADAETPYSAESAGLRVREVLAAPCLADARVLAGASGLDRIVSRLNVMEVPDILPWVKPNELLLTTGYPLRDDPESLIAGWPRSRSSCTATWTRYRPVY
jgi:hypothetical protein